MQKVTVKNYPHLSFLDLANKWRLSRLAFLLICFSAISSAAISFGQSSPKQIQGKKQNSGKLVQGLTIAASTSESEPMSGDTFFLRNRSLADNSAQTSGAPLPYLPQQNTSGDNKPTPITWEEAKIKVEELKTLFLIAKPQDIQERVDNLYDWLNHVCDWHNKLANALYHQDATKAASLAETANAKRFGRLKMDVLLLKAQILIKLNRAPEAIPALINIVTTDPQSTCAQTAYNKLKELGFSCQNAEQPIGQSLPTHSKSKQLGLDSQTVSIKKPVASPTVIK